MFGELGILLNKPRAASVVAKSNTHVAVMLSEHYKEILKQLELSISYITYFARKNRYEP